MQINARVVVVVVAVVMAVVAVAVDDEMDVDVVLVVHVWHRAGHNFRTSAAMLSVNTDASQLSYGGPGSSTLQLAGSGAPLHVGSTHVLHIVGH